MHTHTHTHMHVHNQIVFIANKKLSGKKRQFLKYQNNEISWNKQPKKQHIAERN